MQRSERFYREFLSELKALDDFLLQRRGQAAYVKREDPDVRRLMESMAFFATRSGQMAVDNMDAAVQRLARGHMDEFLSPQPMRALIQAVPNERLVEPAFLPKGSEIRMVTLDGTVGLFTTTHSETILPLAIGHAALTLRSGRGFRLIIGLRAAIALKTLPAPLNVYINYLNDPLASLDFHYHFREHLEAATVVFGEAPDGSSRGVPCQVSFGAPQPREEDAHPHPLATIRRFFHCPAHDLYVQVQLPADPAPWRRAWLCFDLDEDWPSTLVVNKDVFRLFVLPVDNLRTDLAAPILCDGTKSSYAIRAPVPHPDDALHSVIGVYQETDDGLEPILPAHLSAKPTSYGLENVGAADGEPRLLLSIPEAFAAPRNIAVEALWYQPWFADRAVGRLAVGLQTRHIEGVRWQMHGTLTPHRMSSLWHDPFEVLHILSLKSKPVLTRSEILHLLAMLGADQDSAFGPALERIAEIAVDTATRPGMTGLVYAYQVRLRHVEDEQRAVMFHYLAMMWSLLDTWSATPIELHLATSGTQQPKRLPGVQPNS